MSNATAISHPDEQAFWQAQQESKLGWLKLFSLILATLFAGMLFGQVLLRLVKPSAALTVFPPAIGIGLVLAAALWSWKKQQTNLFMLGLGGLFVISSVLFLVLDSARRPLDDLLVTYFIYYALSTGFAYPSYWLAIRGHYRLASWFMEIGTLNFLGMRCLTNSLYSPALLGMIAIVVTAVVIMTTWESIAMTVIIMVSIILIALSRDVFSLYPLTSLNPNKFTGSLETIAWLSFILPLTVFLLLGPRRQQERLLQEQNARLRQTLYELQNRQQVSEEVSGQVLELAAELKISARQQASGSQEHAATVNQINVSVTELVTTAGVIATLAEQVNQTVSNVAEDSQQIEETTRLSVNQSQQGFVAVSQTSAASQEVAQLYQQLVEAMEELDNKSASMQRVLKLISSISGETHLIALNAAIEAAGAGQYGQRFQVVAHEIKNLATRANTATQEVVTIIGEIIGVVQNVSQAARAGYDKSSQMEAVTQQAGEVIRRLSQIANQAQQQASLISQAAGQVREVSETIKNSTFQQQLTITQILGALQGLSSVAQQNAEGSRMVSYTSNDLEKVSQKLNLALSSN